MASRKKQLKTSYQLAARKAPLAVKAMSLNKQHQFAQNKNLKLSRKRQAGLTLA